jgi:hypothetical protein
MFLDASLDFWSIVITQIPPDDIHLSPSDQRHEPLAFASGTFSGASSHWSMLEKEAFPIVVAIDKFDYLSENAVSIFTPTIEISSFYLIRCCFLRI